MANLITKRPRARAAGRRQWPGDLLAHAWERRRVISTGRPAIATAALVAACGVGAAGQFFFDRQYGRRRRHLARERTRAALRRRSRDAVRRAKYLEGVAEGAAHKAAHAVPGVGARKELPDEVTLAQKVESIAFREARVPKGHVSVNAENAVIYLRGQLEREEQAEELVRAVRAIDGVRGVKNLLHTRIPMTEGT